MAELERPVADVVRVLVICLSEIRGDLAERRSRDVIPVPRCQESIPVKVSQSWLNV